MRCPTTFFFCMCNQMEAFGMQKKRVPWDRIFLYGVLITIALVFLGVFYPKSPPPVTVKADGRESRLVRQRRIAADRRKGIVNSHKLRPRIAF